MTIISTAIIRYFTAALCNNALELVCYVDGDVDVALRRAGNFILTEDEIIGASLAHSNKERFFISRRVKGNSTCMELMPDEIEACSNIHFFYITERMSRESITWEEYLAEKSAKR